VYYVSRWPNLRYLDEPLGGAEGLLDAVSFKKATESMDRGRVTNGRYGSEFYTAGAAALNVTGGKGSVNTRNKQQVSVCRA